MYRRSRIRRIAKWSGVVVCVVLVVAWVISGRWGVSYVVATSPVWHDLRVAYGRADVISTNEAWMPTPDEPRLRYWRNYSWSWAWLPEVNNPAGSITCPLWVPFIIVLVPTAYLFYRDRRHPRGHCQKCGYDLQGNVSGVCSECGTEVERS